MAKAKPKNKKKFLLDNSSLRATGLLVLVMFVLLASVGATVYFRQMEERDRLSAKGQALEAELAILESEADSLNQLEAMAGQPQYIERIARDELGMVGSDEIVFRDVH